MRNMATMICVSAALGLFSGCGDDEARPLVVGKVESGTFWKNPLGASSNEGNGYPSGSRIEVFDEFVVVTTTDGVSHLHPHGYYTNLTIKRD